MHHDASLEEGGWSAPRVVSLWSPSSPRRWGQTSTTHSYGVGRRANVGSEGGWGSWGIGSSGNGGSTWEGVPPDWDLPTTAHTSSLSANMRQLRQTHAQRHREGPGGRNMKTRVKTSGGRARNLERRLDMGTWYTGATGARADFSGTCPRLGCFGWFGLWGVGWAFMGWLRLGLGRERGWVPTGWSEGPSG